MSLILLLSLLVDLFSLDLIFFLSLFFLFKVFLSSDIGVLFKILLGLQVENLSVNLVGLREEALELLEALSGILFSFNVESEPGFVFRLSLSRWLFVSVCLPGSDLRADVLCFIVSQNLIHFKLVFVSELFSFLLTF